MSPELPDEGSHAIGDGMPRDPEYYQQQGDMRDKPRAALPIEKPEPVATPAPAAADGMSATGRVALHGVAMTFRDGARAGQPLTDGQAAAINDLIANTPAKA